MSSIRQVREADFADIKKMQAEWLAEYELYNTWDEQFLRDALGPYFLAFEQDGTLVGYVLAENRIHHPEHNDVLIHDLFVRRLFRGQKVASQLLDAVVEQAKQDGAPQCQLTPRCDPEGLDDLVAMYRKKGFDWEDDIKTRMVKAL
jgi:GNAT superfamily N-acetyltransferase